MNRVDELLSGIKIGEMIRAKKDEEKKNNTCVAIFAIVGVVVIVAILAYVLYKVLTPEDIDEEYEDDYDDSFNDFDEDEDDDEDVVPPTSIKDIKVVRGSATDVVEETDIEA
jgi:hypothetical protein